MGGGSRLECWLAAAIVCVAAGCSQSRERGDGGGADGGAPDTTAICDGVRVDLARDPANCGSCGDACESDRACDEGVCCTPVVHRAAIDLLFVIDDSSLAEEINALAELLPRLIGGIANGDANGDGAPDFDPPDSIHAGVITGDMGTGGFTVPTCSEPSFGHDGVFRMGGNTALPGCEASYPPFLELRLGADEDPSAVASALRCLLPGGGYGGCGWEQPLEAALKAVTPSSSSLRFSMGTTGHGDGANAGFRRADATLVVIVLMDEDDCSVRDPELFNPDSTVYEGNLNMRCFEYPDALQPVSRFVDGLLEVVPSPQHLIYAPIAGLPWDLTAAGASHDAILADERMQLRADPTDSTRISPSCNVPGFGLAYPPRRLVEVARGLESRGALTTAQSVCHEELDLEPAIDAILALIGRTPATPLDCIP